MKLRPPEAQLILEGFCRTAKVSRGGVVEFCEEKDKTWRYRVRTSQMVVVVAFRSETICVRQPRRRSHLHRR